MFEDAWMYGNDAKAPRNCFLTWATIWVLLPHLCRGVSLALPTWPREDLQPFLHKVTWEIRQHWHIVHCYSTDFRYLSVLTVSSSSSTSSIEGHYTLNHPCSMSCKLKLSTGRSSRLTMQVLFWLPFYARSQPCLVTQALADVPLSVQSNQ